MTQQQAVNFLPEDYVEKRAAARSAVVFVGLFVLELAAIVGVYFYFFHLPLSSLLADQEKVRQEFAQKSKEVQEFNELREQKKSMVAKAEVTAELMERVHRSKLLGGLMKCLPKNTSLTYLELKTKDAPNAPRPPTKLEEARKQMEGPAAADPPKPPQEVTVDLMGLAPSHEHVAMFMDRLGRLELVQDPKPLFSEEYKVEQDVLRRFKVTMKVHPQADTRVSKAETKDLMK